MGEPTFLLARRCHIGGDALPRDLCDCGHPVVAHAPTPGKHGLCGWCTVPKPLEAKMAAASLVTSMTREQARELAAYLLQLTSEGGFYG